MIDNIVKSRCGGGRVLTSESSWLIRLLRVGKHCFTTSKGGGGFLLRHRLEIVQVTFLVVKYIFTAHYYLLKNKEGWTLDRVTQKDDTSMTTNTLENSVVWELIFVFGLWGEEGQLQQFFFRATFSSFSRPSHLEILVLWLLCVLKFLILEDIKLFFKYLATFGHRIWMD